MKYRSQGHSLFIPLPEDFCMCWVPFCPWRILLVHHMACDNIYGISIDNYVKNWCM